MKEFPLWTRRVEPRAGDLVFTYEASLHRYAIIPTDFKGCLGRRTALLRPNPDRVDTRYMLYYFLGPQWQSDVARRINIGCALLHRPRLLLLDEPTVGIDPQARARILEFVRGLAEQNTSILYTTHYLEEAETLCHRIGIIDHGKLLAEGTLNELQGKLGGDRLFVIDGNFVAADPTAWNGFAERYHVIQQRDHQLVLAARDDRHPSECLRDLLELPVDVDNVTVKKPTLNDVFLQLTGRELRE